MLRKELHKFCETKLIQLEPKRYYQDFLLKQQIERNQNQYQTKFAKLFDKYIYMNEELDARWKKQDSFLEDIQMLVEKRSRPAKAQKDFKKRAKRQSKLENRSNDLTQQIRNTDFELFEYWLQFNNYLSPIHKEFKTLSYNKKLIPFRTGALLQNPLQFSPQQIYKNQQPSLFDQTIMKNNLYLQNVIENTTQTEFILNDKLLIQFCQDSEQAKQKQFEQIRKLQQQLGQCNLYQTPNQLLENYEANKIEIVMEINGIWQRVAYCCNTLNHISERYFLKNQVYILFTVLE